jgi:hypothetical protein
MTKAMAPYLPPVTWLDDLIAEDRPAPDFLLLVERVVRAADPLFRVHVVPGSGIRGLEIQLRDGRGRRHALLGEDDPLIAAMRERVERSRCGVLDAASMLVSALPIYLSCEGLFRAAFDRVRRHWGEDAIRPTEGERGRD